MMRPFTPRQSFRFLFAALVASCLLSSTVFAQDTTATPTTGGVEIDADGVLNRRAVVDTTGQLTMQRLRNAQESLSADVQQPSELRKVSLVRLEREVEKLVAAGKPVPADMQYLAGMTRITHVFAYPDNSDLVIAGPAEGYFVNGANRVVGTTTGQATLQLQDLVVALRAFAPSGEKTRIISVSIDPTPQGLAQFVNAYQHVKANFNHASQANAAVETFRSAIGMHDITFAGVSPKTHFAQVLVEADYDMKLIGIGLIQPPVRITSFIEKARPNTVSKNSLQRWFFQPNYEGVTVSEDSNAMELTGVGVKLVGEDERVGAGGTRKNTGSANRASEAFCDSFTEHFDELAMKSTLYGELRNLIDLSITAAFIQKMDLYAATDWKMETFGSESALPVEVLPAPTKVAPVLNAVWKAGKLMTPIGGGVNIQPRVALNSDRVTADSAGTVAAARDAVSFDELGDSQWWWD